MTISETTPLLVKREGDVLVLAIHTPGKRNAISPDLYQAIYSALDQAQNDVGVGAVVLTGADGYFCSGGDLNSLAKRRTSPPEQRRERIEGLHDVIRRFRDFPKPVIAAVEGGAAGAGLSLAFACDIVIAARDAMFSVAYVKVGLTPDGGATYFLSEVLPRHVLTELCLTGDRINAEGLHRLGAVNRVVDAGQVQAEALALASQLASGPARAIASIKTLCREASSATLDEQLDREAEFMVAAQGDPESEEGINAFLEKRRADFGSVRRGT